MQINLKPHIAVTIRIGLKLKRKHGTYPTIRFRMKLRIGFGANLRLDSSAVSNLNPEMRTRFRIRFTITPKFEVMVGSYWSRNRK